MGILSLSRGAPSLTSLDLHGCVGVTDAGIAHLSSLAARLESLRLEGLPGLSDDGVDALLSTVLSGGASSSTASVRNIIVSFPRECMLLVFFCISGVSIVFGFVV